MLQFVCAFLQQKKRNEKEIKLSNYKIVVYEKVVTFVCEEDPNNFKIIQNT